MFSPTLADLHFSDVSDQGRLSPRARLTLSKTDKRIANIPLAASSVAFVYPLPDLADALSLTDMAQPAVALISIGGYVYWDDAGNIVGVNSLSLGPGLNFAGPFPLQAQPGCSKLRDLLEESGRVIKCTLGSLVSCGVVGFCWISPGESFDVAIDHDIEKLWPHGGFMYFYAEEYRRLDCLYKLTDAPQVAVDATAFSRQNVAGPETNLAVAEVHRAQTLSTLGPFRPTAIDFASIGLAVDQAANEYTVRLDSALREALGLHSLVLNGDSIIVCEGSLSVSCAVTLDAKGKDAAGIPLAATSFVFSYPMRGIEAHLSGLQTSDPRSAFLAIGGFVYMHDGCIVGVNSLSSGYGLHFEPPRLLTSLAGGGAIRDSILAAHRLEQIQLPALRVAGVTGVSWVGPGESFGECDASGSLWPHGAFVYLFEESMQARDVLYVLHAEPPHELERREMMRKIALEAAKSKAERGLVDELYGNDIVEKLKRTVASQPRGKVKKIGQLGPFSTKPVDFKSASFAVSHVDAPTGGTFTVNMDELPAPPPPSMYRKMTAVLDSERQRSCAPQYSSSALSDAPTLRRIGSSQSRQSMLDHSAQEEATSPRGGVAAGVKKLGRSSFRLLGDAVESIGLGEASQPLPPDWAEASNGEGKIYYWNTKTRETRWTRPGSAAFNEPAPLKRGSESAVSVEARNASGRRTDVARLVFKKYDKNKSGTLTEIELAELFADLEHDLNRAALRVARRLIDTNDDGELSYDEFVEWWHLGEHRWAAIGYGSEAQQTALQDTVALFDAFMPTSGLVYGRGLRGLHTRLTQEGMTSKAVKEWAQDVGNPDGNAVCLRDFARWMNGVREGKEANSVGDLGTR